jgi:hypothetical protein
MIRKKLLDPAERGRKGGKARLLSMTPEERQFGARRAALARWRGMTKVQRREIGRKTAQARWARERAKGRKSRGASSTASARRSAGGF